MSHRYKKKKSNNDRNKPCPCGSGKKYKKCCWNKNMEELYSINTKIKENEEKIKEYTEEIRENEKRIKENVEKIRLYEENLDVEEPARTIGNISPNGFSLVPHWQEGTRDKVIDQLKVMVYESGEYPYIRQKNEDRMEVHSICKHGVCRSITVAVPVDFENVSGLWVSDESWEEDYCSICDAGLCPECGEKHALVCPQCHNEIQIKLSEDEAVRAYTGKRNVFTDTKCIKCGSNIFTKNENAE